VPPQVGHLVLQVVHLAGQGLHLAVCLVTFGGERRDLGFHLCDVSVDLSPLVAPKGDVEAGFGHDILAERKKLTAV
jgi:hypothetical protein